MIHTCHPLHTPVTHTRLTSRVPHGAGSGGSSTGVCRNPGSQPQPPGPLTPPPRPPKTGRLVFLEWPVPSGGTGANLYKADLTLPGASQGQVGETCLSGSAPPAPTTTETGCWRGTRVTERRMTCQDSNPGARPRRSLECSHGEEEPSGPWEGRPGGVEGLGSAPKAASYSILSIPSLTSPTPAPGKWASLGRPHLLPGPLFPSVGVGAAAFCRGFGGSPLSPSTGFLKGPSTVVCAYLRCPASNVPIARGCGVLTEAPESGQQVRRAARTGGGGCDERPFGSPRRGFLIEVIFLPPPTTSAEPAAGSPSLRPA